MSRKFEKYLNELAASRIRHLPVRDKRLARKFVETTFWVVTRPMGSTYERVDSVFEANFEDLVLQAAGGLELGRIIGIFPTEEEAEREFQKQKEILGM